MFINKKIDQVSALVASAGNSTLSAGYAGEDVPKTVIPTHFSHLNDKSYFGDNGPDVYRPGYQVSNTMKDSLGMSFHTINYTKLTD